MRGNIDERGRKLFIGGLHLKTTEDSLKAFYSQWGDLIDVVVMRDPQSGKSRGFGFVTYDEPSSVDVAQSNRPHEIDGIKVDSKRAMPKEDTSPEFHATVNRLFVGRLKKNLTSEDLKEYFTEFGTIADAVIINSPTGESRGFGFVTFDDPDSVDKIIVSRPHQIDGQTVEVKKALPRDDNKNSTRPSNTGTKSTPRGGFNNTSFNPRFQDSPNKTSYGNFANPNGNYRSPYNASASAPYSQNYSAPNKPVNPYNEPFDEGYSEQPAYNSPAPFSNQTPYTHQAPYGNQAPYSSQTPYSGQTPYSAQPPFNSPAPYSQQQYKSDPGYVNQPYKNEPAYGEEPDYSYSQYSAPSAQPTRPYGYPPQGGAPDYAMKPPGGPMRGSASGFGRGGRFGTQPY